MTTTAAASTPTASAMSPLKGLMILGVVVVLIVAFVLLMKVFGNQDPWAGFLFLTYWAGREDMKLDKLPMCAGGALFGLFMAYLLQALPPQFGGIGVGIALIVIVAAIYCQIMGWFLTVVNVMTMLFLTVGAVPHIQKTGDFAAIAFSLIIGIVFFGGLAAAPNLIGKKPAA
jgi:hypothetical protein